jgi:hypothetical protein
MIAGESASSSARGTDRADPQEIQTQEVPEVE